MESMLCGSRTYPATLGVARNAQKVRARQVLRPDGYMAVYVEAERPAAFMASGSRARRETFSRGSRQPDETMTLKEIADIVIPFTIVIILWVYAYGQAKGRW